MKLKNLGSWRYRLQGQSIEIQLNLPFIYPVNFYKDKFIFGGLSLYTDIKMIENSWSLFF